MAAPGKHRRILAAQLDGATRRQAAMQPNSSDDDIAAQQQRIDGFAAEIAAHDTNHRTPVDHGSGGLWGTDGPARNRTARSSSRPTGDTTLAAERDDEPGQA